MILLPRSFFDVDTLSVARRLLGQRLVRVLDTGEQLAGVIVETEAYLGQHDRASHAFLGPTPRNNVMYGPPGYAYVYLIYGMYYCMNVVTEPAGTAGAVLLRALEPCVGLETMRIRRGGRLDRELTSGPGRLCQALGIDRSFNGSELTQPGSLFLAAGEPPAAIETSRRVGITADDEAREQPWRFYVPANPFVSGYRAGVRRTRE